MTMHEYRKSQAADLMRGIHPHVTQKDMAIGYHVVEMLPISKLTYQPTLFLGAHETPLPSLLGSEHYKLSVLGLVFVWPYIGWQNRRRNRLRSESRVVQASYDDLPPVATEKFRYAFCMPDVDWSIMVDWVWMKMKPQGIVFIAQDMPAEIFLGKFKQMDEAIYLRKTMAGYWLSAESAEVADMVIYAVVKSP